MHIIKIVGENTKLIKGGIYLLSLNDHTLMNTHYLSRFSFGHDEERRRWEFGKKSHPIQLQTDFENKEEK